MAGYSPLHICGNTTGLVQERENFLLPNDAYPVLQNAYVWRERIKRKRGYQLIGRLRLSLGTTDGAGNFAAVISPQPIQNGIASFEIGSNLLNDPGGGNPVNLLTTGPGTGTLNRVTGALNILAAPANTEVFYYPGLPVMGIWTRERNNSTVDQTIFFDQNYAYVFDGVNEVFQEFIPGTTWNAHGATVAGVDFFWATNYWTTNATPSPFSTANNKLFWVTNNTGEFGANADSPRITDGTIWVDFFPTVVIPGTNDWSKLDATNFLTNWRCMLPFRGRMVTFNTWEGPNKTSSLQYSNRIRWSVIGNPFIPFTAGPPARGSWRDDIRGQGGFLDIPTSEDIISVGFVRDNLVIYCERSTWQLRYTGRSIAPFQVEKVNSELGAESSLSAIQFDTSLLGIGDKGIVECDSYKSERIDVKIPDFVFQINQRNDGTSRVCGIRDFVNRLAFWTIPLAFIYGGDLSNANKIFPNQRLVYNYENDSWALFDDSLTALGTFQVTNSTTWLNTKKPWIECNFPWISQPLGDPVIVGGNQQGFIEDLDRLTTNDVSLFISNIEGSGTALTDPPTVVTSPHHNMRDGFVIEISGIPSGSTYEDLNGGIFGIFIGDNAGLEPENKFRLMLYDPVTDAFSIPQRNEILTYEGGGLISIRENFNITSKKFNFLDEGRSIQLGFIDILMESTEKEDPGAIALNIFLDYNDIESSNTIPQNSINDGSATINADTFFNSVIPTSAAELNNVGGTKFWQRVICPTQGNFITIQYVFNNAQMAGDEVTKDVQIDSQILWLRKAGKITQI